MVRKFLKIILNLIMVSSTIIVIGFVLLGAIYIYWGPFPIPIGGTVDLGDGYKFVDEQRLICGAGGVDPKVLQYAYNDNYIIAVQDYSRGPFISGDEFTFPYDSVDTDKDNLVYWILNKKTNKSIALGTENEFVKRCDSLEIADRLVAKIIKCTRL